MGNLRAFSLKAMSNGLPVFLLLTFAGNLYWLSALVLTLLLSAVAYILGDLLILPATGNLVATIADAILAFGVLWGARLFGFDLTTATIVWVVIALMLVEGLFYHPYLKRLVSLNSMGPRLGDGK